MQVLGNVHEPTRNKSPLDIPETLQLVCSFLDRGTLLAASRVSRPWRACCYPLLWSWIGPNAWTSPYLLAHWKQHAHLIRHVSLAHHDDSLIVDNNNSSNNNSDNNNNNNVAPSLLLLRQMSEHCHELVSIDASLITIRHPSTPSSFSSDHTSAGALCDLIRLLLHNRRQLRSLRLALQGRIPRDLVHALSHLQTLQELMLDRWTDPDEYSLQLILLQGCPPSLQSLTLSDNDFLPFSLESLKAMGGQQGAPVKSWLGETGGETRDVATTASAAAAAAALTEWAWAKDTKKGQKRASDPTEMAITARTTVSGTVLSTARLSSGVTVLGEQQQQEDEEKEEREKEEASHHPGHMPQATKKEMGSNKVCPNGEEHKDYQHLHLGSTADCSLAGSTCHPPSAVSCFSHLVGNHYHHYYSHHAKVRTAIRSLTLHRAAFRQGFLLNLVSLCPQLERLSLLESRSFFPTSTLAARLARQCPRLHAFEFSSPATGQGNRQPDLSDAFFVSLLEQFPDTTHLVVGGRTRTRTREEEGGTSTPSSCFSSSSHATASSSFSPSSNSFATGAATGFSLAGWRQLMRVSEHRQYQQLVHVTIDGVRGLPSKSVVQLLERCSSLKHWSARGVVLNARHVQDPAVQPWACRHLQVFIMDISMHVDDQLGGVMAAVTAVAGGTGPVQDQQQQQQAPDSVSTESVEKRVRRWMYGQLGLLGSLVHVGLGGGHGFRRRCGVYSADRARAPPNQSPGRLEGVDEEEEEDEEEEPGIDLSCRSGVEHLQGCWPFLEVLDVTRLGTDPRWRLSERDEAWIARHFPRLGRIIVGPKNTVGPRSFAASYTQPLTPSTTTTAAVKGQQSDLFPWIRCNRPDIIIDEQL